LGGTPASNNHTSSACFKAQPAGCSVRAAQGTGKVLLRLRNPFPRPSFRISMPGTDTGSHATRGLQVNPRYLVALDGRVSVKNVHPIRVSTAVEHFTKGTHKKHSNTRTE
jgi:hypothetical protein